EPEPIRDAKAQGSRHHRRASLQGASRSPSPSDPSPRPPSGLSRCIPEGPVRAHHIQLGLDGVELDTLSFSTRPNSSSTMILISTAFLLLCASLSGEQSVSKV